MGILRYIVQGFGWEIGSQAAREGIDALKERTAQNAVKPSRREAAKLAREQAKQAARERKRREADAARQAAQIEAQLDALKKKVR